MFSKEKIIFIEEKVNSKKELFEIVSTKAVELGISDSVEDLVKGFEEREALGSTGFQDGLGIPHCKSTSVKMPAAFFVRAMVPIEWDTFDNQPLTNMFALLIPVEGEAEHLQVLTKISRKMMNKEFRANIKATDDKDEILELLKEIN